MQNWMKVVGAGVLCTLLASTAALADIQVKTIDEGWQIDAQDEPLTNVLGTISKKAGIKVSGITKLVEDPSISGVFEGSLESVLRRLLRGSDYAFETVTNEDGMNRIVRLIVLSGIKGKAPTARAINTAKRLPSSKKANGELSAKEREQGTRVTSILTQRAQLGAGNKGETPKAQVSDENQDQKRSSGSGITRNTDGSFDITPEAQARMAEATRRAQQDLQALVAAIQRNDDNQNGDN